MTFCTQVLVVYHGSSVLHSGMRYWHDCTRCVPLGRWKEFDLYYCDRIDGATVIARYGDEGFEYISGLIRCSGILFGVGIDLVIESLEVACRRASEMGLGQDER